MSKAAARALLLALLALLMVGSGVYLEQPDQGTLARWLLGPACFAAFGVMVVLLRDTDKG